MLANEKILTDEILKYSKMDMNNQVASILARDYQALRALQFARNSNKSIDSDSDFAEAVRNSEDMTQVWRVLDKHMEGLRIIAPKSYNAVLNAIR